MDVVTDVAIIGAGPTGSYLANRLAQLGVAFVLVERRSRAQIRGRHRAGLLERRAADLLERHGLADGLLTHGKPHHGAIFRTPHGQIELDMAACCGGKTRVAYPQSRLVDDLLDQLVDRGADVRFEHEVIAVDPTEDGQVVVCHASDANPKGNPLRIRCAYVVAADGHAGLGRRLASARGASFHRYRFPYDWLALMAQTEPSTPHAIYGIHPRGFAGHMIRTDTATRFYLQIQATESTSTWTDPRIWEELERRLAAPGWVLRRGGIVDKRRLELRSEIIEPMALGRLLLAGDAAHLLPPCGGKGMNLGLMDAEALAEPLAACTKEGHDPDRLLAWSKERLADTWTTFEFSHQMTELLHNAEDQPDNARFAALLKARWLEHLVADPQSGAHFARRYIGV